VIVMHLLNNGNRTNVVADSWQTMDGPWPVSFFFF